VVRDLLGDDARGTRLLDAYCGTGTIGLYCADRVAEVVGVEVVRDAVWDARENADRNGIGNCTFLAGDMSETLPLVAQMPGGPFGRVIMDPPRGGMDKRSLRGLLALGAPVLIYVSCNPGTLARDLQIISEAGYRPTVMQPVDLFPQTYHIETVLRFEK
jgi:23S rRNA (uracil1939-C5)-methyltransferase